MNRAVLISTLLLTACAKGSDPPNCALAPSGFYSWRDAPYSIDQYYRNVISISNETISWNGVTVGTAAGTPAISVVDHYLETNAQLEPVPSTAVTFEKGVACSRVTAVRALMEKHLACRINFGRCLQGTPPWQRD